MDLSINPNTVARAYRELELTGALKSRQGIGTFIDKGRIGKTAPERTRKLDQLVSAFAARAGREGVTVRELRSRLKELTNQDGRSGKRV